METLWGRQAVREFCFATALLGLALFLALASESAMRRGDTTTSMILAVLSLVLAAIVALTIVPRLARRADLGRWLMISPFAGGYQHRQQPALFDPGGPSLGHDYVRDCIPRLFALGGSIGAGSRECI